MKYEIIIDSRVLEDFAEAFEYYNKISCSLSTDFNLNFLSALDKILLHPKNYFQISTKLRRITLKKYPYMLIYQIEGNKVKVRALFHQSIRPSKLKRL